MFCVSGSFDCSESHVFVGDEQRSRDQWILLYDTIYTSPNNGRVTLAPSLAEARITWYSETLPFWHLKKKIKTTEKFARKKLKP